MRFKKIRAYILPVTMTLISLLVLGVSLGIRFLDLDTYKDEIIAGVRSSLGRELSYQSGAFSFRPGPGFTFTGIRIKEKDGASDFVRADRLTVGIALLPLIEKKVVLTYLELERPLVNISRDAEGVFNVSDLLKEGGEKTRIQAVRLKKGRITFTDKAVAQSPVVTELSETDLAMNEFVRGKECHVSLKGMLKGGGRTSPVELAGSFRVAPAGTRFTESTVNAKLHTGAVDATHFFPYYGRYLPFRRFGAELETDLLFRGKLNAFKGKGSFKVTRLFLDYPQVFHATLTPRLVKGAFEMELTPRDLDINLPKVNVDGLNIQGGCRLSDLYGKDLHIGAHVASSAFDLKNFHQYIPYGIIVKDVADFIEQKIRGGIYKIEEARLDGRVSQILHLERVENANVISVRAHVDGGVIAYGPGIPLFGEIKGNLALAGRDFTLTGMSGRFGSSPFTLEGSLADYAVQPYPTRYPFTMILHPRQTEALWLLGKGLGEKLTLGEGSVLKLTGSGTTSLFNLGGEWDLGSPGYLYAGALSKPPGRPNTASFQGSFSKREFTMSSLKFRLPPLELAASARYRYGGGVALEVTTNQFPVGELAPLFPTLAKYHPGGRVQAQLHGKGRSLENLAWEGEVGLAGVSFKGSEKLQPFSGVTGNLRFGSNSAESSQISGRIGNSAFHGKGSISGFKSPAVSLSFSSPMIDLSDLGLGNPKQPVRAEKVQGSVSYREGNLQIASLSGQLGHSLLSLSGTVQDQTRLDLQVNASHLELEDLATLSRLSSGRPQAPLTLKASLAAAEGKVHEVPFRRLRCTVLEEEGILYLQGVEASILDGDLSGKFRIDPGQANQPRYQASFSLQRASTEKFLHALGVKRQEVTGTAFVSGELTAKGGSAAELKGTALGSIKLRTEHGSIRRFSVLSKVFSILNVSQLLKFHLPDMVSGGMPYKKITGDIAVKDGVASTSNLFIDSDAINMSTVGKIDMVKNELDLTIGVQPLQTVDKVVSKIPIVGWILTGRDKSLVTTYFEAKGSIEDPKVTAVPVKSLAKGVFNIFKRVFELPARLITDTGEVVIGK